MSNASGSPVLHLELRGAGEAEVAKSSPHPSGVRREVKEGGGILRGRVSWTSKREGESWSATR